MKIKNLRKSLLVKIPLTLSVVGFTLSAQAGPPERLHDSWNNRYAHTAEVYVERHVQVVHPPTVRQRHGYRSYTGDSYTRDLHRSIDRVEHRNFRRVHSPSQVNIVIPLDRGDHRVRRHSQRRWLHG